MSENLRVRPKMRTDPIFPYEVTIRRCSDAGGPIPAYWLEQIGFENMVVMEKRSIPVNGDFVFDITYGFIHETDAIAFKLKFAL